MRISKIANPRQVILLTCRFKDKDNVMTLAWHTPLSFYPPMYAVVVGKTRFSYDLIKKSKCFVVNFVGEELEKEVLMAGSLSGRDCDKFEEIGLEKGECQKINAPYIKSALGYLECKVVNEIETGDHVVFVGEVLRMEKLREGKRLFYLGGDEFTTTLD